MFSGFKAYKVKVSILVFLHLYASQYIVFCMMKTLRILLMHNLVHLQVKLLRVVLVRPNTAIAQPVSN
uniref:Uncharacterized protein n=1 Tax=Aegilops tauschii subsp. strangulata TaxID=200361 RepID=A0A453HDI7_AEGTS